MAKLQRAPAKVRTKKAVTKVASKKVVAQTPYGLVDFSFQDVAYQIDLDKSKVYRKFIEVEKSRQSTIISAYRTVALPRPAL